MAVTNGRYEAGLFDGGWCKAKRRKLDHSFTNYSNKIKGNKRFFDINSNVYGSGAYNGPLLEVDPENYYYTFGASVYTYQLSYNNRTGSGHMGIRQYDAQGNLAYYYMCGRYGQTTLSRPASPGDTSIFITSNSGWYTGTSTGSNLMQFYPSNHPLYSRPYFYSRLVERYDGPGITLTAQGDYEVPLANSVNDWGYSLPAGTPVANGRGTNSNSYIITGNTNFDNLNKWRTFKSGVRHGYVFDGGNFINGITHVRFLHLRNYTYRTEQDGDSARYYLTNVMCVRRPNSATVPTEFFQRGLHGAFY